MVIKKSVTPIKFLFLRIFVFFGLAMAGLSVFNALNAEKSISLLSNVDELHQIYKNYNEIDDVYDRANSVLMKIYGALINSVLLHRQPHSESKKIYDAGVISEEIALEVANLEYQLKEMNESKISPKLLPIKEIVNQIVQEVFGQYVNFREIKWMQSQLLDDGKDLSVPTNNAPDKTELHQNNMAKIADLSSSWDARNEKIEELDDKLIKEQQKLIAYHQQITENVKKEISENYKE